MEHTVLETGRFDRSFVIHMIRDFFLVLVAVVVLELGGRYLLLRFDFDHALKSETTAVADRIASDLRQLMLNSGGPVAARTIYPIMKHNHESNGFLISIEPSPVTVSSIKKQFGVTPHGIAGEWPNGTYNSSRVDVRAETFCLRCHVDAREGDVLGTVEVRSYFQPHLAQWWAEVRLVGMIGLAKIFLHTIVLFFLLRIRMEPLLALNGVVSRLAQAGTKLSLRAEVNSHDEFGDLATHLNQFLERISHIVEDLCAVLDRVGELNVRISTVQNKLSAALENAEIRADAIGRQARFAGQEEPLLSQAWMDGLAVLVLMVRRVLEHDTLSESEAAKLNAMESQLSFAVARASEIQRGANSINGEVSGLSSDIHGLTQQVIDMAALEEKMQEIASSGRIIAKRLV